MGTPLRFVVDVVVAVAVSDLVKAYHLLIRIYLVLTGVLFFMQTHPQQNMIASGSIDSDLTVKIWVDRGST